MSRRAERDVYRPDIVGWRRDRVPGRPAGTPIQLRPDWICEVLSPSNPDTDRVKKLNNYHLFEVPHERPSLRDLARGPCRVGGGTGR
jgi:Uma2 family endonuclease